MPRIAPIHWTIFECILFKAGFAFSRQNGSHRVYIKTGSRSIVIPVHSKMIDPFIIQTNIKTAGISRDDYFKFLALC
ncbi:MAG: type II toxin-antitoxin system HicA family toxin [Desulfobacterales bacterium]|nr:type II toxin-antitoxin system HicA family toxin [Desulfobacterales bacterium]MBF0398740.1 type II toxin-antitoxin system HicA family toxin [Desulfobacterales bacterium]